MISVLLPTRGRPEGLKKAVDTLLETAAKPDELEFIFRFDDDEPIHLSRMVNGHVLTGPRLGYSKMHLYYEECIKASKGELLLTWNDDTEMLTPDWDVLLTEKAYEPGFGPVMQFIRRDINPIADDTLPLVPRCVYEAMGHLSLHCYVDSWLSCVANLTGMLRFRNDVVFHHHRLSDQTAMDNQAATKIEHDKFHGFGAEQAQDVVKVKAMLMALKAGAK